MFELMNEENAVTQIGSWRRVHNEEIYDNPWIRVSHDRVITPAGTDGIYGVVHFKNRSVGIIPVDEEGCTWLVRQFRYPPRQSLWEIPMGGGDLKENPVLVAHRELSEETGLHARHLQLIMHMHVSPAVTDEEGIVFVAHGITPGTSALEHTEADLQVTRLPLTEAIQWVLTGKITDVISCAGLLKLHALSMAKSTLSGESARSCVLSRTKLE